MANYNYDESGNMSAYFLITFLVFILIPLTLSITPSSKKVNVSGCQCQPCVEQRKRIEKREKGSLLNPKLSKKTIFVLSGWTLLAFLVYKVAGAKYDNKIYDPFEILGIKSDATEKEIKSVFKGLSKKFHPDKVKASANETIEAIQNRFVEITKAYKSLTDETIRKNWEQYGNPDGRQETSMGIAIPRWLVEAQNNGWVLGFYGLLFGGALPAVVGRWWFGSRQKTKDGINARSAAAFFKTLKEDSRMDEVVGALGKAFQWEQPNVSLKAEEKAELERLEKLISEQAGKSWEIIKSIVGVDESAKDSRRRSMILLYAHLLRLDINKHSLKEEQTQILLQTPVLLNALLSVSVSRNWLVPTVFIMRFHSFITQALLPHNSPIKQRLAQLPGIKNDEVSSDKASLKSEDFAELVSELEQKGDGRAADVKKAVEKWGRLEIVDASYKVIGERIVTPSSIVYLVLKLRISPPGANGESQRKEPDVDTAKKNIKVNEEKDNQFLLGRKDAEDIDEQNVPTSTSKSHPTAPWYRPRPASVAPTTTTMAAANYANANANNNIHGLGTDNPPKDKDKKTPDSLFGPNIGVISSGPSWTTTTEKKVLKDELTMDIVKSWIEKSKEPSQATTTLQALVNLKRPTLRLSPIDDEQHSHSHALEFEFDCDAPKCGIYVNVLLPPGHPEAPSVESAETPSKPRYTKALVFESIVDGGFGKTLKLEQGAVLELGRYEFHPSPASSVAAAALPAAEPQETPAESQQRPATTNHSRRRITHFFHRRRHNNQNLSVSGPALAVVDASSPANPPVEGDKKKKEDDHEGVKVTIRLAALDDQGTELHSPNEQVTYLCVERFGARPEKKEVEKKESGQEGGSEAGDQPQEAHEEEHDNRPWVVKVVKREATIGPHTFQLHEIYGLTSSSNAHTPPALPPPSSPVLQQHTYPPQPAPPTTEEEDPTSECLLCLSSPREVVLLPCRHLVACKECALNMVEFGAGGAITQSTGDDGNGADGGADGGNAEAGGNAATTTTPTTANPRRKRKAKGWFCPVCRQPYTSLLRITTNPPPEPVKAEPRTDSQDEERDVTEAEAEEGGLPLPVTTPNNNSSGGLLSRPVGLFRSLTGRSTTAN